MRIISQGKWNEKYWDAAECKALRGIAAIGIILHHMAQKTAASWVPAEYVRHGLDPFVNLGYILVGIFFFCSGYGLYLSVKAKQDYLTGFIGKHFRPIVFCYIISNCIFYLVGGVYSGYNWYIYAILYMYLAFFLCFKFCKKERTAIILLTLCALAYIVFCDFFAIGTWCYNTIGIFVVGLVFAKYRESIVEKIRQRYVLQLVIMFAVTAVAFAGALLLADAQAGTEVRGLYNLYRIMMVLVQFIASSMFSILLFDVNQRMSVSCKVLEFLGSMSLELYLMHVLFVEMFSYYFVSEYNESVAYIQNPFLYALVVLVLSVVSAYALTWLRKGWMWLIQRYDTIFAAVRKDIRKVVIGLLIVFAAVTVLKTVTEAIREPELQEKVETYRAEHLRMIDVNGQNVAVYDTGSGDQTVLIVAGYLDPCPTITQRYLADELAKEYRVVVIDRPGTGFSDPHTTARTVDNICTEIHSVAASLGLERYILLTAELTSVYSPYYANKYVSELQAVVTLDAQTAKLGREGLKFIRQSMFEYERGVKRSAELSFIRSRLVDKLGYRSFLWPIYKDMFTNCIDWHDDDVIYTQYFKNTNSAAYTEELALTVANNLASELYTYPKEVAVLDFVSDSRRRAYTRRGIDIYGILDELAAGSYRHEIVNSVDGMQLILVSPDVIRTHLTDILAPADVALEDGDRDPLSKYSDRYVLTDDDTVTWDDIESGYVSSDYNDYIDHNVVLCEYTWKQEAGQRDDIF